MPACTSAAPLVRRAILVRDLALAVDDRELHVVVGVDDAPARRSVADLEVHDVLAGGAERQLVSELP